MITKWDSDSFSAILSKVSAAESASRELYLRAKRQDVSSFLKALRALDISGGAIEQYQTCVTANYQQMQNLVQNMRAHQQDYDAAIAQGTGEISRQGMQTHSYGWFVAAAGVHASDAYEGSAAWSFVQSGKRFSEDYNDMGAFLSSAVYQEACQKAGISKWSDLALIVDSFVPGLGLNSVDEYVDGLLESAMASVLDGLPDDGQVSFDGSFDALGQALGVENIEDWAKELKNVLASYGQDWKAFAGSEEYLEALSAIKDEEMRGMFAEVLKEMLDKSPLGLASSASSAAEALGQAMDTVELADLCIQMTLRCMNDYSVQIGYLDAMEEGLLAAGFGNGPVLEKIGEMRAKYADVVTYALDETCDYLWGEVKSAGIGAAVKAAGSVVPAVKGVDFGLKIISGGAKVAWGEEISAYEKLSGLRQYDYCLTTAFENYEQMMRDGVATAEDVATADRLYELLRSTKISEYDSMIDICEAGGDAQLAAEYRQKRDRLAASPAGESGSNGSHGGGFR